MEKATIEARKEEEERVQRKIERLKTAQGLRWAQIEQQREKQQKVNVIVIDSDEDESANRAAEKVFTQIVVKHLYLSSGRENDS